MVFVYFTELSKRRFWVSPPPAVVPDNPINENAWDAALGSYFATASAISVFWRPNTIVPKRLELNPAKDCWKACPHTLESRLVVCVPEATLRPLFSAKDLHASLISPDCGLKNVSTLNTADQSSNSASLPFRPMRDWLKLLGVNPVME